MGCQLIGESLRDTLNLPIPGPVIGMFLLAAVLACRGSRPGAVPSPLEKAAETLISIMGLLFVPAGVGIVAEAPLLGQQWMPIVVAVVGSTVLSLAVTGFVMNRTMRWSEKRQARALAAVASEASSC
jgi:putative effector of murein hydrolase LrgA (UPF0299 family)